MRSMTGFGQASGENERHAVAVTLRAVNHRFLDLRIRLAEEYRGSEPALRELVAEQVLRGRLEIAVDIRPRGEREAQVEIHRGLVKAMHLACRELVEAGLIAGEMTAGDLLRLPEVLRVQLAADIWSEDDQRLLLATAGQALAQLVAARQHEGDQLAQALGERLAALTRLAQGLAALRHEIQAEIGETLRRRLEEMLAGRGLELDEQRLAQEVALLVDKSDVSEELDRLAAHLHHFREVMGQEGSLGKRLDFLTQEIFRELNTLGAKCRHAAMIRQVLDAKVLCEQVREQVQNVE